MIIRIGRYEYQKTWIDKDWGRMMSTHIFLAVSRENFKYSRSCQAFHTLVTLLFEYW